MVGGAKEGLVQKGKGGAEWQKGAGTAGQKDESAMKLTVQSSGALAFRALCFVLQSSFCGLSFRRPTPNCVSCRGSTKPGSAAPRGGAIAGGRGIK